MTQDWQAIAHPVTARITAIQWAGVAIMFAALIGRWYFERRLGQREGREHYEQFLARGREALRQMGTQSWR